MKFKDYIFVEKFIVDIKVEGLSELDKFLYKDEIYQLGWKEEIFFY